VLFHLSFTSGNQSTLRKIFNNCRLVRRRFTQKGRIKFFSRRFPAVIPFAAANDFGEPSDNEPFAAEHHNRLSNRNSFEIKLK
jgi:hypothetical protein